MLGHHTAFLHLLDSAQFRCLSGGTWNTLAVWCRVREYVVGSMKAGQAATIMQPPRIFVHIASWFRWLSSTFLHWWEALGEFTQHLLWPCFGALTLPQAVAPKHCRQFKTVCVLGHTAAVQGRLWLGSTASLLIRSEACSTPG